MTRKSTEYPELTQDEIADGVLNEDNNLTKYQMSGVTTDNKTVVGAINELDTEIGIKRAYVESADGDALTVVANDTTSPTTAQIKLNDVNKYGQNFQIGDKVKFRESTGMNNKFVKIDAQFKDIENRAITTEERTKLANLEAKYKKEAKGNAKAKAK